MGHVINPVSFRLYFSKYWNSNWYTLDNYSYFLLKDLQLNEYFYSFFHKNKRNRVFFYKKFMYNSLSLYKKVNKFFITLNVFDFRLKTYNNIPYFRKYYMPIVHQNVELRRLISHKKFKKVDIILKHYKKKFKHMPWLYRNYMVKLTIKLQKGLKDKGIVLLRKFNYTKKFFFAYVLYIKQSYKILNNIELIHGSLKSVIFNILFNYYLFLDRKRNINILPLVSDYNKFLTNSKLLLNLNFVNKGDIKQKILNIKSNLKKKYMKFQEYKFKKYYIFTVKNLIVIKNLFLKYKNLLFLVNKRIELFTQRYGGVNFLSIVLTNLYWRRDRLVALIYFLRKKSKNFKLKFTVEITRLKNNIHILTKTYIEKVAGLSFEKNLNLNLLIKNISIKFYNLLGRKYLFLNLFNSINILNKKFLLFQYLNLLDKSQLLRFNYRFSIYKQGILKFLNNKRSALSFNLNFNRGIKGICFFKFSTYNKKYFSNGPWKHQKKRKVGFWLNRSKMFFRKLEYTKDINFKFRNFYNIFLNKLANLQIKTPLNKFVISDSIIHSEVPSLNYDKLKDVSNLINSQIDLRMFFYRKKQLLLKKNLYMNYSYFLKFLIFNKIYHFPNVNLENPVLSINKVLINVINNLKRKNFNKKVIRIYLKKKYVFFLLKNLLKKKTFNHINSVYKLNYNIKKNNKLIKKRNKYIMCKYRGILNINSKLKKNHINLKFKKKYGYQGKKRNFIKFPLYRKKSQYFIIKNLKRGQKPFFFRLTRKFKKTKALILNLVSVKNNEWLSIYYSQRQPLNKGFLRFLLNKRFLNNNKNNLSVLKTKRLWGSLINLKKNKISKEFGKLNLFLNFKNIKFYARFLNYKRYLFRYLLNDTEVNSKFLKQQRKVFYLKFAHSELLNYITLISQNKTKAISFRFAKFNPQFSCYIKKKLGLFFNLRNRKLNVYNNLLKQNYGSIKIRNYLTKLKKRKKKHKYLLIFGRARRQHFFKKLRIKLPLSLSINSNFIKLYMFNKNKIRVYSRSFIINKYIIIPSFFVKQQGLSFKKKRNQFNIKLVQSRLHIKYKLQLKKKRYYNFLQNSVFFNLSNIFLSFKFRKYLYEFNQAKRYKLNLKKISHSNLYTWNKASYQIYKKKNKNNLIKYDLINNIFLKKSLNVLKNYKNNYLIFYNLIYNLMLKRNYNFAFNYKLNRGLIKYNKLFGVIQLKNLLDNYLLKKKQRLFFFNYLLAMKSQKIFINFLLKRVRVKLFNFRYKKYSQIKLDKNIRALAVWNLLKKKTFNHINNLNQFRLIKDISNINFVKNNLQNRHYNYLIFSSLKKKTYIHFNVKQIMHNLNKYALSKQFVSNNKLLIFFFQSIFKNKKNRNKSELYFNFRMQTYNYSLKKKNDFFFFKKLNGLYKKRLLNKFNFFSLSKFFLKLRIRRKVNNKINSFGLQNKILKYLFKIKYHAKYFKNVYKINKWNLKKIFFFMQFMQYNYLIYRSKIKKNAFFLFLRINLKKQLLFRLKKKMKIKFNSFYIPKFRQKVIFFSKKNNNKLIYRKFNNKLFFKFKIKNKNLVLFFILKQKRNFKNLALFLNSVNKINLKFLFSHSLKMHYNLFMFRKKGKWNCYYKKFQNNLINLFSRFYFFNSVKKKNKFIFLSPKNFGINPNVSLITFFKKKSKYLVRKTNSLIHSRSFIKINYYLNFWLNNINSKIFSSFFLYQNRAKLVTKYFNKHMFLHITQRKIQNKFFAYLLLKKKIIMPKAFIFFSLQNKQKFPRNKFLKNFSNMYRKIKQLVYNQSNFYINKHKKSWIYFYNKNKNKLNAYIILKKNYKFFSYDINKINRLFFINLLKILEFNSAFIKQYLFLFNRNLFIFIIKYLLLKKYFFSSIYVVKSNRKNIYISSIMLKNTRYAKLYIFLKNLNLNFLKDKYHFLLLEKFKALNLTNGLFVQTASAKINLFIIYFNLLLKYRLNYKNKQDKLKFLLLIFNFQKYMWLKDKKYKYFLYNKNFINMDNNKIMLSVKKSKSVSNWKKINWRIILSKFKLAEKFFLRLKFKGHSRDSKFIKLMTKFRIRLKIKILGASYYYFSFFFKWHLTRLFFKNQLNSIFIRFHILLEPTAFYISKYICNYLKKGFKLYQVIKSLVYDIPKLYPNILAIQVKCVGRHTRKERASRDWFRKGTLRTANIKAKIDFASTGVILRYGYTNVKVWLLKIDDNAKRVGLTTSFV